MKFLQKLLMAAGIVSLASCSESPRVNLISVSPPPSVDSSFTLLYPFWSYDGSKILFIGHVFGREGYDFYEVDPAGGIARLFMRDTLAKSWPTLSPDGTKIAYLAAELGRLLCCAHVWVMNVDGTNARDLTPFFSNWEYVRWSPDSRFLTFDGGVEDSGEINYQIVKANVQTGELALLTSGRYGNRDATFLPDGRITYRSDRIRTTYGGKVWVMNADGSDPQPIDTTGTASTYPRPSPIHNEIYFTWGLGNEGNDGLYSVNLDSAKPPVPQASLHFLNRESLLNLAQWSPDENWIICSRGYTSTSMDLVLVNRQGSLITRLTQDFNVFLFSYAWSPDSQRLVFNATDDHWHTSSFFTYDFQSNTLKKLIITRN